jgi:flagellar motor switch protein FliG
MSEATKNQEPTYKKLTHSFIPFDGDEEIEVAHHFKKPTVQRIDRTVSELRKSPTRAFSNLLKELVKPEEKEQLEENLKKYPGLPNTFGNAILTRMGFGELGN